jgi:hypothetical protein
MSQRSKDPVSTAQVAHGDGRGQLACFAEHPSMRRTIVVAELAKWNIALVPKLTATNRYLTLFAAAGKPVPSR